MMLTVYRQPVLYLGEVIGRGPRARKRAAPQRTTRPLETFVLEADLRPAKRVGVRFPFGDWIEFRDSGEAILQSMADYVLAPESVRLVHEERLKEEAEARRARKARAS